MAKKIIIPAFVILVVVLAFKACSNDVKLKADHRFTIGEVQHYKTGNFRYKYLFIYTVNDERFQGRSAGTSQKPSEILGKKFFVMFHPMDPGNSEILLNKPVGDSLNNPPSNCWTELP